MKHIINLNGNLNTNMIDEITNKKINKNFNIFISRNKKDNYKFSTIYFKDITDENNYKLVKKKFKQEINKYILNKKSYLIIGIGNEDSNMDSLGPKTVENILVTKHLLKYGLDNKYNVVSKFIPNVESKTGIDLYKMLKNIIKEEKPDQLIIIDSLIANNLDNITKCIQISNTGINLETNKHLYKKSLNFKNLKIPITLIGVPTILETSCENIIVTTKDIDVFINKVSNLICSSLNEVIHNYKEDKIAP